MESKDSLCVLNLVRWYPNRYDPMPGLFIQRHIEASSFYCKPAVVYTHQVEDEWNSKEIFDIVYTEQNSIPTAKVYYKASNYKIAVLRKLINIIRFFRANSIGIKLVKKKLQSIDVVHVHILTRLGLIAYLLKFFKGIPFIVTEHWSRYLEITNSFNGVFRKLATRFIVKRASSLTAVTQNLANSMQKHGLANENYVILPNVVDELFLNKELAKQNTKTYNFIHISCFEDKSKNISGLLRVIKQLSDNRTNFTFTLVGDGEDFEAMKNYSSEIKISDGIIEWKGLLEGEELVNELSSAQMLVIFSNYENFPVVINEALSMGIPAIATKVGGIPEYVNSENGILVNPGDEVALLKSFEEAMDDNNRFNNQEIKKKYNKEFSPQVIGNQINELYRKSVSN